MAPWLRWNTIARVVFGLQVSAALADVVAAQSPTATQAVPLPIPATAQLVEDLRLDGARVDLLLSNIKALLPHASGDLWLVEHSQSTSSIYSSTGAVPVTGTSRVVRISGDGAGSARDVGRSGSGPGEWQLPAGLTALPDGRVVLFDNAIPNRLTLYRANGALDTTLTLPIRVMDVRADTAGLLWVMQPPVMKRTAQGATATPAGTRILDSRGRDLGAAPEGPRPPMSRPSFPIIGSGSKQSRLIPPYLGANLLAWSPAGEFVATFGDSGRLVRYPMQRGQSGEPVHGWQLGSQSIDYLRRVPRVAVTEQERAEQRARLQEIARRADARRALIPEIPTEKPYFGGARFDVEGRLWLPVAASSVRRPDADFAARKINFPGEVPNRWYEPAVFDVFDTAYRPLGRVALPMRASLGNGAIPSRGDVLWVVLHDADDVPTLVRYRLRWGARGE